MTDQPCHLTQRECDARHEHLKDLIKVQKELLESAKETLNAKIEAAEKAAQAHMAERQRHELEQVNDRIDRSKYIGWILFTILALVDIAVMWWRH